MNADQIIRQRVEKVALVTMYRLLQIGGPMTNEEVRDSIVTSLYCYGLTWEEVSARLSVLVADVKRRIAEGEDPQMIRDLVAMANDVIFDVFDEDDYEWDEEES